MIEELKRKIADNKRIVASLEKSIASAPKGRLRIASHSEYFLRTEKSDRRGRYLRKEERHIASAVAQRDYEQKIVRVLAEELELMETLLGFELENPIGTIYDSMNPDRRNLVRSRETSNEKKAARWKAVEYERKGFSPGDPRYETRSGLFVRSKSEMFIADVLTELGVPFRYEFPVELDNGHILHPDFMILNARTGAEIIWEHLGMLDDPTYRVNALNRIIDYSRNGYVLGKNLLISFECQGCPINLSYIRTLVKRVCV